MLSGAPLSLIIFRWSIFCLLCYKCAQLAKAYALPKLYDAINNEQLDIAQLMHRDKLAMLAKQKIENQIREQDQLLTVLEYNMRRWHQSLVVEKERCEQEQQARVAMQQAKYTEQQKYLFLSQNMLAILPRALETATLELTKQYSDSKQAAAHIDSVIAALQASPERPI